MDGKVRLAYVGCGYMAQLVHVPNFKALSDECEFVALAEPRADVARAVAARYGIPKVYRSHEQIAADPDVQAVGVSAPYALQGTIAEDLVLAGKHVFMEKPMAVSVARGERMVAATRRPGAGRLMVAYMKRHDTGNVIIKRYVDQWRASGEMGRLLLARSHGFCGDWLYGLDPNVPMERSKEPAPAAPDDAPAWLPPKLKNSYLSYLQQWTHNVNLLRFFLGDDGNTTVRAVDLDDDGVTGVIVLNVNGARAVVETGNSRFHGWDEHTQVHFEGGWLRTDARTLMHKESPATVEVYRAGTGDRPPTLTHEFAPPAWSYREEARRFLHCVRTGEAFASSAEDTLNDVRLFEDVYREFVRARP